MMQIATLAYHDVTDDTTSSGFQRPLALAYKHRRAEFDRHLDAIAAAPIRPSLVHDIDFAKNGARHVLLTFDDGGRSAMYVGDRLSRRGWRGHFLITTSLIGRRTFLDKAGILELRRCGHVIGSHSHTHPDIFWELRPEAMDEEWRVSCDILSQLLGEACETASVPGGDASGAVLRSAAAVGVRYLFTSEPMLVPWCIDQTRILGRVSIKAHTTAVQAGRYADFRSWNQALLKRRCSLVLRRVCHPLYARYVRRQTMGFASHRLDDTQGTP